jgi:hypothetical protein
MIHERRIRRNLEGSVGNLIELLSRILLEMTEEKPRKV